MTQGCFLAHVSRVTHLLFASQRKSVTAFTKRYYITRVIARPITIGEPMAEKVTVSVIKADVGGFGSTVLRPILKDVPVINKILPAPTEDEYLDLGSDEVMYSSLDDAINRIKELETDLQKAKNKNEKYKDQISELKKEVKRLSGFEEEYSEFEKNKEEFYNR